MGNWREGAGKPKPAGKRPITPATPPNTSQEPADWRGKKVSSQDKSGRTSGKTYLNEETHKGPKNLGILNLLLVVLAVLVGSFIAIIGCQPTKTPMLHVAILDHTDPLWAPNGFASEDLDNFVTSMQKTAASNIELITGQDAAADAGNRKLWLNLNDAEIPAAVTNFLNVAKTPGGPRPGGWILYFSCHGVTNYDGIPYLVASNSEALSPGEDGKHAKLVPLETVLRTVAEHPTVKRYPKAYKLLVFDMGRMESQWSANRLYNDFPTAARNLANRLPQDISLSNTFLLLSNDDGQKAWSNPDDYGTNFGLFFGRGIMGESTRDDDSVSLAELYRYLQKNVDTWASQYRSSRQTPVLIPVGAGESPNNILLAHVGNSPFQITPRAADNPADPSTDTATDALSDAERLAELWNALQLLGDLGALRLAPARFSLIEYDLVDAERMVNAGSAYQEKFETLCSHRIAPALDDLAKTLAQYDARAAYHLSTSQLSFFRSSGLQKSLGQSLLPMASLASWEYIHGNPPSDGPTLEVLKENRAQLAAESQMQELPEDQRTKPLVCTDYYAAASRLLPGLAQQREMTPENIDLVLEFLIDAPNSPVNENGEGAHLVEVEYLMMLGKFLTTLKTNFAYRDDSDAMIDVRHLLVASLNCRVEMERLAIVGDQRVFAWIEPDLTEADRVRREAEDRLFALQFDQAAQLLEPLLQSSQGLEAIRNKKELLTRSYRVADSVPKSIPFLLEWLAHHPYAADVRQQRMRQATAAIEQCHQLVSMLNPPRLEGEERPNYALAPLPDKGLVDNIAAQYSDLVAYFNRQSQDTVEGRGGKNRSDAETLLEAYNLMRARYVAPLDDAMQAYDRNSLRKRVVFDERGSVPASDTAPQYESALLPAVAALQRSPWQMLLGQTGGPDDYQVSDVSAERAQAAGELLTEGAQTAAFAAEVFREAWNSSLALSRQIKTFPNAPTAAAACAFSGLVTRSRSLVESNRETPPQLFYRVEHKEHLAWLADRAMEDFWGNDSRHPYFDRHAMRYLSAFNRETVTASSPIAVAVNSRLSLLRKDALEWVALNTQAQPISDTTEVVDQQLTVHFPATIPAGICTIDLLVDDSTAVGVQDEAGNRQPTYPLETQPSKIYQEQRNYLQRVDVRHVINANSSVERVRFRGHSRRFPFELPGRQQADSVQQLVDVQPFPFRRPEITVEGDVTGMGDVIFIVDCSGSMEEPLASGSGTRMKAAKAVLSDILKSMASSQGKFRVLTMAFGSRMGWESANARQPSPRPGAENVPQGLLPGNDVMTLASGSLAPLLDREPLRDEAGVNVARLVQEVDKLAGYGETPLYYSIWLALQKVDPSRPTQIIVISDGENQQSSDTPARYIRSSLNLADELKQAKYRNVQLQIVTFDLGAKARNLELDASRPPASDTLAEAAWLARFAGRGGFIPADRPLELRQRIEELIKAEVYYSVREKNDPRDPRPYDFGATWYAEQNFQDQRREFEVRELQTDDTVEVQLRGGEKLHLAYDNGLKQLVFTPVPVEEAGRQQISVTDSINQDGTYLARVLNFQAPDPDTGTLEIPVRLENTNNTLFTVRPYHIWAEITPSPTNAFSDQELFETRFFGDLLLRNETQFPEFLLRLDRWQPSARWARVKLFLNVEKPIEPEKTISLQELLVNNASTTADFSGGKVRVEASGSLDQYTYQVVVRVEPGSQGILPHHIQISPSPPRIMRTYTLAGDGSQKILNVTHRFLYQVKADVEADVRPRLDIWSREQLTSGATSFTLDVQIPR